MRTNNDQKHVSKIDHHPFNNELQIRIYSSARFPFSSNSNLPFSIRDPEFPLQQQPESTLQQDSPSAATRIYTSASETRNFPFSNNSNLPSSNRDPEFPLQQQLKSALQHQRP